MASLAYTIRILRQARGFTSAQLAGKAQISPTYLSLIEAGERIPPAETLAKLATALGVDAELFLAFGPEAAGQRRSARVNALVDALRRLAEAETELKRRLA